MIHFRLSSVICSGEEISRDNIKGTITIDSPEFQDLITINQDKIVVFIESKPEPVNLKKPEPIKTKQDNQLSLF